MKIIDGTWSLVVVGRWNKYILTPNWVARNVFRESEIKVEFPIETPDLPPRYVSSRNIIFMPAVHRVSFIAQPPYSEEMFSHMENMCLTLLQVLKYTPISGLGINFGFEEDPEDFEDLNLFQIGDSPKFSDEEFTVQTTEIKRSFELPDGRHLNFNLISRDDKIIFDFNYHYTVKDTDEAIKSLSQGIIEENKNTSIELLSKIYGLTLEEEN